MRDAPSLVFGVPLLYPAPWQIRIFLPGRPRRHICVWIVWRVIVFLLKKRIDDRGNEERRGGGKVLNEF